MTVETELPNGIDDSDLLGSPIQRREDPEFLTGQAKYTDDLQRPNLAHLGFCRSQYSHAEITKINDSAAREIDGVIDIFTYEDILASGAPGTITVHVTPSDATIPEQPILADGRVRFQGEPIAVVVAEDRYTAREAADEIEVSYEPLDSVVEPEEAVLDQAPTLHEAAEDNIARSGEFGDEDVDEVFDNAPHTVSLDLQNQRLIPTAMEARAALASFQRSTGELTVEMGNQNPHQHRDWLAETLGHPPQNIRLRTPKVGGGFGSKIHPYPAEAVTAWVAMQLDRPVKWSATRSETFMSEAHGRGHDTHAEAAFDTDGTILGLRVETYADIGAYVQDSSVRLPFGYAEMLSGQYDIPCISSEIICTFTNTVPVDAYRGAGRPEACYVIERIMNAGAGEIGVDPVEIRRKNFIPPDSFPHQVETGRVYDSGNYEHALDLALELADYEGIRERTQSSPDEDRRIGVGISSYVEGCGFGPGYWESSLVRFRPSGEVTIQVGTFDHGQGHHTSFAQIAAEKLGIPYEDIKVVDGDTAEVPEGHGSYGSRSASVGGSAVTRSIEKIIEHAKNYAASILEVPKTDLEFDEGEFHVKGAPQRSIHIQEIARVAYEGEDIPPGLEPGLEKTSFFEPDGLTYPFGAHVAVVEIDPETGEIEIIDYVAVDDCGNQINPKIVEGQIHGSIAQGLGQARYEEVQYDKNGTLVSGSFQDYTIPKAEHMPELELDETVTPSPFNPLGVKGVGEAGAVATPPAIVNATLDALRPIGVKPDSLQMPLTDETVWKAVKEASDKAEKPHGSK